jgi:ABC-type lipoprotein release transport system permease subunit
MKTYLILAWRNCWRNRRRTWITISAIAFAVLLSILMQSLNRGSHDLLVENMARYSTGYLQIRDVRFEDDPSPDNAFEYGDAIEKEVLAMHPDVRMVIPRIQTFMLAADDEGTKGALVMGVDPEREQVLNGLMDQLVEGRFFSWKDGGSGNDGGSVNDGSSGIEPSEAVVSAGLAERMELAPGDTLALIGQGRFGMSASGLFVVSGIVKLPVVEMDRQTVYLSLPQARYLLSAEEHVTSLLLLPRHKRDTDDIAQTVRTKLAGTELTVATWEELMPDLLEFIKFDMAGSYVLSIILYVVIGFGFFGTVLTLTLERRREFGVLLSVGLKRRLLSLIIFLETLMVSVTGVLIGWLLTTGILLYFVQNPIQLTGDLAESIMDYGWEPILPVSLDPGMFLSQGLIVFFLAVGISLYPMAKIARLKIIEASRS